MSNPPTLGEIGTRALRVAKIKARELQQATMGARNTVQNSPKVAGVVKTVGTVGKVAKVGLPVVGGLLDAGIGLAEGEDPTRAIAGAAGSTAGGIGGAWAGAGAGAAVGAVGAPFTFGLSVPVGAAIGGIAGAVGGSLLGGWGADRVDQAVRGKQPIDAKREQQSQQQQQPGQTRSSGNNSNWNQMGDATYTQAAPSYPDIKGQFKPDLNATYSYQPMRPDGSGGVVTRGSAMPAPIQTQPQQQRGQLQAASFNQGGNGRPGTVNVGNTNYLQGFEPGGRNSGFRESAALGAPQTPSPNQQGQLMQAGFNPLPAIGRVLGKGAAAAPAAAPAAAAAGKLPINPVVEFGKEVLKQSAFLPLLGAAGLLYKAPVAAVAAAANPRYANPQPALWDQVLFGGAVNRMFGQPQGFEYQKLDVDSTTKRREQDMRQNTAMRGQDVQTYKTDVGAETQRRGQDLGLVGKDLTSGRQLEGTKYRSDRQFQGRELRDGGGGSVDRTNASKERQVTQTNQTRYGVADLTSGRQLQGKQLQYGQGGSADRVAASKLTGTVYNADSRLKGTVYNADSRLQGTAYTADQRLEGVKITSGSKLQGDVYKADRGYAAKTDAAGITGASKVQQEGVKQAGVANVANIKAGATMGAADIGASAKVKVAGLNLSGTEYKADATVRVADLTSSRKLEAEETKARNALNTGVIKSANAMMQSDEKNRMARLKQLGVY